MSVGQKRRGRYVRSGKSFEVNERMVLRGRRATARFPPAAGSPYQSHTLGNPSRTLTTWAGSIL